MGQLARSWDSLQDLGTACKILGQLARSWDSLQDLGTAYKILGQLARSGDSLQDLGTAYKIFGQLARSWDSLQDLWTACKILGQLTRSWDSLQDLGTAYKIFGQLTRSEIPYTRKFSLVQNFAETPPDAAEENFYFRRMRAVQATLLPNDCHASSLTRANLARSVTVKIDVDDEARSQVATTVMESSFLVEAMVKLSRLQGHFSEFPAWFIYFAITDQSVILSPSEKFLLYSNLRYDFLQGHVFCLTCT